MRDLCDLRNARWDQFITSERGTDYSAANVISGSIGSMEEHAAIVKHVQDRGDFHFGFIVDGVTHYATGTPKNIGLSAGAFLVGEVVSQPHP